MRGVVEGKRKDGVGTMMAMEKVQRGHDDCWVSSALALKEKLEIQVFYAFSC